MQRLYANATLFIQETWASEELGICWEGVSQNQSSLDTVGQLY
jgi:hypothetical protein